MSKDGSKDGSKKSGSKSKGIAPAKNAHLVPFEKRANQPLLSGVVQMAAGLSEDGKRANRVSPKKLDELASRYQNLIEETITLLGEDEGPKFMMKALANGLGIDEEVYAEFSEAVSKLDSAPEPVMEVYRLKITLVSAPVKISRTIDVPDCSLGYLHEVLQSVMGWTNSHLHHFEIDREFYGPLFEEDGGMPVEWVDECDVLMSEVLGHAKKKKFTYLYDFGDSWEHQIELTSRTHIEKRPANAICIEGAGAGPPEDVGGVWGYSEMLDRLKAGKLDEELDFLDASFEPEKFDLPEANRELKKLKWKDFH